MSVVAACGIDLGTDTAVIACCKKGGVDILDNEVCAFRSGKRSPRQRLKARHHIHPPAAKRLRRGSTFSDVCYFRLKHTVPRHKTHIDTV